MPRKPSVEMSDGDFRKHVNASDNLRDLMEKTGMSRPTAVKRYRAIEQQNGVKQGLIRAYTKGIPVPA